jgi:V/A-type H+-transporting ATPase subunit B
MELRMGEGLLGRVFNGLGEPIDGYGNIFSSTTLDINGLCPSTLMRVLTPATLFKPAYRR